MNAVRVECSSTDTLVQSPLDMPFLTLVARIFGVEVNFHDVQDHLQTDVPEFLLQIYEEPVLEAAPRI